MQSHITTLILVVIIAFVTANGKQLPADKYGNQEYRSTDVFDQSKNQLMQEIHQPESKQIHINTDDNQVYIPNDVYIQSKIHVMQDDGPCPKAEDIAPCTCEYYNFDITTMNLDCSNVESEDQLRQIFQSDFPKKDFQYFFLKHNTKLKVLESYVFNDISFQSIYINYNPFLKTIEEHALDSCYETTNVIDLYNNNIGFFPFDQISHFSLLESFNIAENVVSIIPAYAFNGLTQLEFLNLGYNAHLINIPINIPITIGNFENLPNLKNLYFNKNKLTNVTADFIKTGSVHLDRIDLSGNNIELVEPDAFDIVEGLEIYMMANSLTTLDEEVWRPYLEAGMKLSAAANPLLCGCDVAWLFDEDQLVKQVNKRTTCGILGIHHLHNLDPSIFDEC